MIQPNTTTNITNATSKEGTSKIKELMNSLGLLNSDLKNLQKQGLLNDILVLSVPLKTSRDISRARQILDLFL